MPFTSENQPKNRRTRGKSERVKFIEALQRAGKTEADFYDHLVAKALDEDNPIAMGDILKRVSPIPKQTAPAINFELDPKASISEKAEQIILAVSQGEVPPDIGTQLVTAMSAVMNIKEKTDFEERLKALENVEQD